MVCKLRTYVVWGGGARETSWKSARINTTWTPMWRSHPFESGKSLRKSPKWENWVGETSASISVRWSVYSKRKGKGRVCEWEGSSEQFSNEGHHERCNERPKGRRGVDDSILIPDRSLRAVSTIPIPDRSQHFYPCFLHTLASSHVINE